MVKHKPIFWMMSLLITFISCGDNNIEAEQSWEMPQGIWDSSHVLTGQWTLTAPASKYYNLYLTLDHSQDFDYQNIYLDLLLQDPQNNSILDSIQSFQLMDPLTNRWLGDPHNDNKIHLKTVVIDSILLEQPGDYTLQMTPYSREAKLSGVYNMGFQLQAIAPQ